MNVSFLIILVLDVISIVTQTEASRRWWSGKSKHKHWNWDRSVKTPICSVGQCVLAWKCPDDAILTEATGSCPYWTDGPWLCCDLSNEHNQKPETNFGTRPSFPDYKQEVTNSWKKKSTTEGYWNNDKKHFTTQDPWKRGAREEPTPVTAADDILRNAPGRPVYNPTQTPRPGVRRTTEDTRSKRTTPPSSIIRTTRNKTPTADSRIVFPTHGWQQKVTKRPDFNTQTPKRVATPDYKPTTKTWSQPTRSTTKAAFQPSTRQPGRTVSAGTRRPAAPTRTWVAGSDERRNDGRATSTPAYATRRPTVPTRAWAAGSDERRNDGRATSTPAYPNQGRTTRTPNRPNTARTTARTTRRNRITTPLPNVNTHMCGIRDQSPPRNRQGRSSNLEYVEFIPSDSRSREGRKPYQRIVGGEEAEPFSWPWVAALYKVASSGGHRFLSAGSLINEHFVLTAAHVFTPDDLKTASFVVMLGTHDAQDAVAEYLVASVVQHPNYEHRYYYNDIALLRLVKPVIFNDYVMPVCLPSPDAPLLQDRDLEGKRVTVMGWGDESFGGKSSRVLKEATFPIVSRTSCNASYVRVASNRFPRGITAEMLCAGDPNGGKDACQGDSGGPLTSIERGRYTQVGIVSFGYQCGDKEFPGVYTKVAPYLSWIAENTQSTEDYMNDYHYDYGG